jgi:hypothetical protein
MKILNTSGQVTSPGINAMPFEPTDEQRRTVKALSGYGVPHEGIAVHIGIDAMTLHQHFRDELDRGSVEATAKVAQTLFHLATVEKNVASVIFWMKARAGWRETVRQENTGADGRPTVIEVVYRSANQPPEQGQDAALSYDGDAPRRLTDG